MTPTMALEGPVLLDPPASWHPDWLTTSQSTKIRAALGTDNVRFVGGCVRDSLLGRSVADFDLATTHTPEETTKLLEAAGAKVVPTGIDHGTVTAVIDQLSFEITSLRSDVSTDGRHATVAFTKDWYEDAARRDFTINALYATFDGKLFDPFGGFEDLQRKHVRFIGEAEDRIREDALRIYRFFRFSARFGCSLDVTGLEACRNRAADVNNLSRERVRDELLKLLSVPDPTMFLREMQSIGVLPEVGTSEAGLADISLWIEREQANGSMSSPETRLALLYAQESAKEIAHAFRLSKKLQKFIADVRHASLDLQSGPSIRPCLYRLGPVVVEDALTGFAGDLRASYLRECENWNEPQFPLSGADLIEAGYESTPELGRLLNRLEKRWIASDFTLSKAELMAEVG